MADSMEGVVVEGEQAKTENVEQKAIGGKSSAAQHALYLKVSLHKLHHAVAGPQDVSQSHDCDGHGQLQVPLPAR